MPATVPVPGQRRGALPNASGCGKPRPLKRCPTATRWRKWRRAAAAAAGAGDVAQPSHALGKQDVVPVSAFGGGVNAVAAQARRSCSPRRLRTTRRARPTAQWQSALLLLLWHTEAAQTPPNSHAVVEVATHGGCRRWCWRCCSALARPREAKRRSRERQHKHTAAAALAVCARGAAAAAPVPSRRRSALLRLPHECHAGSRPRPPGSAAADPTRPALLSKLRVPMAAAGRAAAAARLPSQRRSAPLLLLHECHAGSRPRPPGSAAADPSTLLLLCHYRASGGPRCCCCTNAMQPAHPAHMAAPRPTHPGHSPALLSKPQTAGSAQTAGERAAAAAARRPCSQWITPTWWRGRPNAADGSPSRTLRLRQCRASGGARCCCCCMNAMQPADPAHLAAPRPA